MQKLVNVFVAILFLFFLYVKIDYWFINPVNKDKLPNRLPDLKLLMKQEMYDITQGMEDKIIEEEKYSPSTNYIAYFKRFLNTDKNYQQLVTNLQTLNPSIYARYYKSYSEIEQEYCKEIIYVQISLEKIDNQETIDIWVRFEERGVCMRL
ncbi:hypothetical protein SAMN02745664_12614 [Moraxella cuniculi DSM 21768]|uniref:Uncharacterized protein n=2 Tax=Moraxella cuniculi TaxID=34061 RepID=A0A1N7G988_9GAMM|nr:hypothetical protein [Moraxella cuniculi]OOS01107.1 hypothetical protein B0189_11155 [Moraxella cuniculi]SIS09150.1 hypothetical protein SAMN02745664_12614 [Moraxella cuniculi DSM 21768]VEG13180.1 Uncharacterised protein [Moraxella cuniculi]